MNVYYKGTKRMHVLLVIVKRIGDLWETTLWSVRGVDGFE